MLCHISYESSSVASVPLALLVSTAEAADSFIAYLGEGGFCYAEVVLRGE